MSNAVMLSRRLLVDIQNVSNGGDSSNRKQNKFLKALSLFGELVSNMGEAQSKLNHAVSLLKSSIENDYKAFSTSKEREKEDILIKWEDLSRTLRSRPLPPVQNLFDAFLTRRIRRKVDFIISSSERFVEKLKGELYPNLNRPLSQDQLKELAKKFEHLPKEMLEDLVSDDC